MHPFDDFKLHHQRFAFLDSDHAFLADFLHRLCDFLADAYVGVSGNRADLRNLFVRCARFRILFQLRHHRLHRFVDAALDIHRIHTGGNELHAFLDDGLRKHCCSRCPIAGNVRSLARYFLHHLRAHIFELVLQLDFLRDRNAVLGNGRRAIRTIEHDVATFGAEGDLDRIGQNINAGDYLRAG